MISCITVRFRSITLLHEILFLLSELRLSGVFEHEISTSVACSPVTMTYSHTSFQSVNHTFHKMTHSKVPPSLWGLVSFSRCRARISFCLFTNTRDLCLLRNVRTGPGGQTSLLLNFYLVQFPRKKRPGREDKSLPLLMPRLRINGTIQPSYDIPLLRARWNFYLYFEHWQSWPWTQECLPMPLWIWQLESHWISAVRKFPSRWWRKNLFEIVHRFRL